MGNCLGTKKPQYQSPLQNNTNYSKPQTYFDLQPRKEVRQQTTEDLRPEDSALKKAWLSNEKKLAIAFGSCPAFTQQNVYTWQFDSEGSKAVVATSYNPRETQGNGNWKGPQTIVLGTLPCKVEGRVVDSVPVGLVKIIYANGEVFEGVMVDGKSEGEGKFTDEKGQRFEGCFSRGHKTGYGILTHLDGSRLKATWKNDLKEGPAVIERADGSTLFCLFEGDRLVGTAVELSSQNEHGSKIITLVENAPDNPATTVYLPTTRD